MPLKKLPKNLFIMLLSRNKYRDSESRFQSCSNSLKRLVRDKAYVAHSRVTSLNQARAQARDPHTEYSVTVVYTRPFILEF
jgi:hypothetical protein